MRSHILKVFREMFKFSILQYLLSQIKRPNIGLFLALFSWQKIHKLQSTSVVFLLSLKGACCPYFPNPDLGPDHTDNANDFFEFFLFFPCHEISIFDRPSL